MATFIDNINVTANNIVEVRLALFTPGKHDPDYHRVALEQGCDVTATLETVNVNLAQLGHDVVDDWAPVTNRCGEVWE